MKSGTLSDFHDRKTARKGRRFAVLLIDFFTLVIFSFLFFGAVAIPIFNNLGSVTEIASSISSEGKELYSIVDSTRLQDYDESSESLVSLDVSGKEYLQTLLRTSYYQNGLPYYELDGEKKTEKTISQEETFFNEAEGTYPTDRISFYYLNFSNAQKLSGSTARDRAYLNKTVLSLSGENADLLSSSFRLEQDPFYLSETQSPLLLSYLNYGETGGDGEKLYDRLLTLYKKAINQGISEVENGYPPYLSIFLSYVLGFLVTYVFFPLCFKDGKTIGYRFFTLALVRNDEETPRFVNHLLRDLILFLDEFWAVFFLPLFIGRLDLLSFALFGPVTLFQILLFSFLLTLVSLVFFFISKDNQTLSEFTSLTYTVNTAEHEETPGKAVFGER
jgi:uncharacterized RDD family membrane protein YckC